MGHVGDERHALLRSRAHLHLTVHAAARLSHWLQPGPEPQRRRAVRTLSWLVLDVAVATGLRRSRRAHTGPRLIAETADAVYWSQHATDTPPSARMAFV